MTTKIHTVLGASGAIGQAVLKELQERSLNFRAVERKWKSQGFEPFEADLLNKDEAIKIIRNSSFVYLCVGLPYQSKVWTKDWPILMQNIIAACEKAKAKLIFFDNIYMYGPEPLSLPFNEENLQLPTTKKGIARKQTTDLLLKAIAENRIEAVIGRSADFYGELAVNSPFYIFFLENILKGKAPQVLGKKGITHTYAYSGDNGRSLVELALNDSTYGQVWHLPVEKPITFEEVNEIMNSFVGTNFKLSYVPKIMRKLLSLFIPPLKEVEEMLYQFENPYEMNFDKFKKQFPDFEVTSYHDGIKNMVESFKNLK